MSQLSLKQLQSFAAEFSQKFLSEENNAIIFFGSSIIEYPKLALPGICSPL